jgi:hypothetical protein
MGAGGSFQSESGLVFEDEHSPPSTAKVKNNWNCFSVLPVRLHGAIGNDIHISLLTCSELHTSTEWM